MIAALLLATVIVAFVAGIVALAMPCCFTVLLPAYLAKSFDTAFGRLAMTMVFAAGIATVLLPIALGVSELTAFLTVNHALLFVVGGFFMVILGILTLWGMSILPMREWKGVDLGRKDVPSVYALGLFSGVASTCCAPVLAGVLVLTVFTGGWLPSLFVGLAYVAGMVFPLLVVAAVWDRRSGRAPNFLRGRMVSLRLLRWRFDLHSSKLVAGVLFIGMGLVTVGLGLLDRMLLVPGSSLFGIYQGSLEGALLAAFGNAGIAVGLLALVALALGLGIFRRVRRRKTPIGVPGAREGAPEPLDEAQDRAPSE